MDIEFALIKDSSQVSDVDTWGQFDTSIRDSYFFVRERHEDIADGIESLAIDFITNILAHDPKLFDNDSLLEVAYYYDVNKKAYFSVTFSAKFMDFLSSKSINIQIVGYPCDE